MFVLGMAGCTHAPQPQAGSDRAAVETWLQEYAASWAASDAERMYKTAADDVEWINIVGMHWRGKGDVTQAHAAFLTTIFKGVPMKLVNVDSVRQIGDDGVVAVVHWSVGQYTTPSGSVAPPSEDRITLVFERGPDGLQLVHAANIEINARAQASNPVKPRN